MLPRLLSRDQLAEYLQCSASTVDAMVEDGLIPEPKKWRGLVRWDRLSIDRVIDRVYGIEGGSEDQRSIAEAINGRARSREVRRDPSE
jgi:predicted DNA-binding transcriptional regulator AlpA